MHRLLEKNPFGKAVEDVVEDDKPKNPFPNGPRQLRYLTTGQMRRAAKRAKVAEHQRANKTYRQNWFKDQRRIATLRGWLIILDNPQHFSERQVRDTADIMFLDFLKHREGDSASEHGPVLLEEFADSVVKLKEAFAEDLSVAADRLLA